MNCGHKLMWAIDTDRNKTMKLTTKQLKEMIKEELRLIMESTGIPELDGLLARDDAQSIIQGFEIADSLGVPIDYQSLLVSKSRESLRAMVREPAIMEMPELVHHIAKVAIDFVTLKRIARNPQTLPKTLKMLAKIDESGGINIKSTVAENPNVPIEVLVALSQHKAWTVRSAVARQAKTPNKVLMNLAADHVPVVAKYAEGTLDYKMEQGKEVDKDLQER